MVKAQSDFIVEREFYSIEVTHAGAESGASSRLVWYVDAMPEYQGLAEPIRQAIAWGLVFGGRVILHDQGKKILDFDADKVSIVPKCGTEILTRTITLIVD